MGNDGTCTFVDLDCGIAGRRIVGWLDDELELLFDGGWWFYDSQGHSCTVAIEPLDNRRLGSVELERTRLLVQGERVAVDAFMRAFTLRFVSAGG